MFAFRNVRNVDEEAGSPTYAENVSPGMWIAVNSRTALRPARPRPLLRPRPPLHPRRLRTQCKGGRARPSRSPRRRKLDAAGLTDKGEVGNRPLQWNRSPRPFVISVDGRIMRPRRRCSRLLPRDPSLATFGSLFYGHVCLLGDGTYLSMDVDVKVESFAFWSRNRE